MTNKERAKLISGWDQKLYEMHEDEPLDYDSLQDKAKYEGALEMAEWKDQEFKEYLKNKLPKEYNAMARLTDYERGFYDAINVSLRKIIKEVFNEEVN